MQVRRIVANVATADPVAAQAFYGDILGLETAMDMGWIRTYTGAAGAPAQISFMREGGDGAPMPDLSVVVDDLDEALRRARAAGHEPEYGPATEAWGVRRFFLRDPFGRLVNILVHLPDGT